MTPLITCKNIHQSYSGKVLFDGLEIGISEGERLGLIGANGNGKSTLLQIFARQLIPDDGEVSFRKGLRLAYVNQTPQFKPDHTASQAAIADLREHGIEALDAEVAAATALSKAGFDNHQAKVSTLSGGWQKRLQIVVAMALEADVVMFDEPTNHLDLEGVLWLESILKTAPFAWVVVSHDRFFLENTVNKVAELDASFPGGMFSNQGGYDNFVRRRQEFLESQSAYASSLQSKMRREDAWLARGPKARTTKAQGRIDQAMRLKGELAEVKSRLKTSKVDIDFVSSGRKTKKLIAAENLAKKFGEGPTAKPIVSDFSLTVRPGECIGLLGKNGSGKTTVLKMLAGELSPDAGKVEHALDLEMVYFDQHRDSLDPTASLKKALCDSGGDSVVYRGRSLHVVSWANKFRFSPEQLDVPVGELSGGEQARVVIARLMLRQADVLCLDEPTNDLDIPTLETLEQSLSEFPGAVLLVTHDRYLMNKLCTKCIGLDGEGGFLNFGGYEQWQQHARKKNSAPSRGDKAKDPPPSGPKKPKSNSSKKLSYMDQREYDAMEEAILAAETNLANCQAQVEDPELASSAVKLQDAYKELEKAQAKVDALYARWAELEAKMEQPSP